MMDGCILIRTIPGEALGTLKSVEKIIGVRRVFLVYGQYDIVAFIEAPTYEALSRVTAKIHDLKTLKSTETLLEALSEKDTSFDPLFSS
jgi:uncharacterized protein with GYD domain